MGVLQVAFAGPEQRCGLGWLMLWPSQIRDLGSLHVGGEHSENRSGAKMWSIPFPFCDTGLPNDQCLALFSGW